MLSSLLLYLFTNIKLIGEGSPALFVLGFSVMIGIFMIVLEIVLKKSIYIKKSFLFLILFFIYFIVNITLNRPNDLKALLLATTGGIILFYILGSLVSTNLFYIKEKLLNSNKFLNMFNFLYIVFSIFFLFLLFDTFYTHLSNVRTDLFLISSNDGMYQRAGDFLIISFFIYSFITTFFLSINKYLNRNKFVSLLYYIFFSIYCLAVVSGMLLSQLIGSNNTFVNLGGLLFASIVFYIFINFTKSKHLLSYTKLNIKTIFLTNLGFKIYKTIFLTFLLLIILFICIINIFDVDLSIFRIFGFGSGDVSSVSSRLALLDNFLIHFDYNPIFGNMAVDILTTGEGSYAHSFILSLLSHLGIIGFILFFIYLFVAIKEKLKSSNNLYVNNLFALYSLIVFAGIFAIASFGTFITWIPLWFLLGLISPPIKFKNRKEKQVE